MHIKARQRGFVMLSHELRSEKLSRSKPHSLPWSDYIRLPLRHYLQLLRQFRPCTHVKPMRLLPASDLD